MSLAAKIQEARTATRSDVVITAQLRVPGSSRFDISVLDLSTTGFRCETFFGLMVGQRVYITIPSFAPLEAHIVRKDVFSYGCLFVQPLHEAVLATIAARFARPDAMR